MGLFGDKEYVTAERVCDCCGREKKGKFRPLLDGHVICIDCYQFGDFGKFAKEPAKTSEWADRSSLYLEDFKDDYAYKQYLSNELPGIFTATRTYGNLVFDETHGLFAKKKLLSDAVASNEIIYSFSCMDNYDIKLIRTKTIETTTYGDGSKSTSEYTSPTGKVMLAVRMRCPHTELWIDVQKEIFNQHDENYRAFRSFFADMFHRFTGRNERPSEGYEYNMFSFENHTYLYDMLNKALGLFMIYDPVNATMEYIDRVYVILKEAYAPERRFPFRSRQEYDIDEAYHLLKLFYG